MKQEVGDKKLNLGPGQYNLDKVEAFPVYKFKESSVFVSKVERVNPKRERKLMKHKSKSMSQILADAIKQRNEDLSDSDTDEDAGGPGPGQYMTLDDGSDFKLIQTPAQHQHFGPTVDRFPRSQKRKMDVPFYDIKKLGYDRKL